MFWSIYVTIRSFWMKIKEDRLDAYAAQSAFFIILSIIPFLILLFSFASYTIISKEMLIEVFNNLLPEYVMSFVNTLLNDVYDQSVGLISVSALVAIWSAAKSVQYLTNGVNAVYGIIETRNWIVLRIRAAFYMILFVLMILFSLVLLIFGNKLQLLIEKLFPFVADVISMILNFRMLISFLIFVLFFTMIYTALPNQKVKIKNQLPGAILCAVAWSVFSNLMSVYINLFHGFSTYGSLSAIVLVMFWLYFCMYITLICAEINVFFSDYINYTLFLLKKEKIPNEIRNMKRKVKTKKERKRMESYFHHENVKK